MPSVRGALWTPPLVTAVATPAAASSNGAGNGGGATPKTPTLVATDLGYPLGLSMGPDGQVYVADFGSVDETAPGRILRVDPGNGTVAVLFSSTAYWPSDVSFDAAGNLYFTDYGWDGDDGGDQAHEGGRVVVVASGSIGSDAPVVTELATGLDDPSYLLVDPDGSVYVSDTGEPTAGATPTRAAACSAIP